MSKRSRSERNWTTAGASNRGAVRARAMALAAPPMAPIFAGPGSERRRASIRARRALKRVLALFAGPGS